MAGALMALQRRRSARNAGDWKGMATAWSWCLDPASDVRVCALNDVAGWWEDAVDVGLGGGGGGSGVAVTWGVNEIELGASSSETLYGSDAQQLDDLQRLGAGVARHLYKQDLTWERLSGGESVPVSFVELTRRITRGPGRVKTLVELAFAEGRTLIFTCIVYGGARDIALDSDPPGTPAITYGSGSGVAEAYSLTWAEGHATSEVSGTRQFLDIRNSYELDYLGAMGEAIGQLLGAVAGLLTTCSLADVVAGIEIFDVIGDRNVFYQNDHFNEGDPEHSAVDWAHAFYVVASRLSAELSSQGIPLPIRLPGLSSYYQTADRLEGRGSGPGRNSAEYRVRFLTQFLDALSAEAASGPVPASDISSGINIGWDRGSLKEGKETVYGQLGMGHIGAVVGDLARYRSILDAAGYPHTSLSVLRTGISVNDPDTVIPFFASWLVPSWWTGLSGTTYRQHLDSGSAWFQAYDVWRRPFGAAAGHAAAVGWETWMSKNRGGGIQEGYGMGLRDDRARDTRSGVFAVPRPSWLAYQRMTTRVGSILSAEMINPTPPTDVEYEPVFGLDYLVIIGARVTNAGFGIRYAYLLLIDPTIPSTRAGSYSVEVSARSGIGGAGCWQVPTVPKEAPVVGNRLPLPPPKVTYDDDVWLALPNWLIVKVGDAPVLLLSSSQLEFAATEATAIDHGPGDPTPTAPTVPGLVPPVTVWYTPENADESTERIVESAARMGGS